MKSNSWFRLVLLTTVALTICFLFSLCLVKAEEKAVEAEDFDDKIISAKTVETGSSSTAETTSTETEETVVIKDEKKEEVEKEEKPNTAEKVLKVDEEEKVFTRNGTTNYQAFTEEEAEKLKATEEKFEFQTEVSRLMTLIINSLYKTREIFLRELISNASDAIDKIRFLALTDPQALGTTPDLNITILADKPNRRLIITDTGVGMTKKQLKENLGTIAKSGTSEFLNAIDEKKADMNLIGQFGVGFYSVFLVADKVTVATKHNNESTQYIWESHAVNDFTIAEDPRGNTLGRGTQIVLDIKEDSLAFLEQNRLNDLIKKYSEFINFPIYLWTTKEKKVEIEDPEEKKPVEKKKDEEKDDLDDEIEIEDVPDEEEEKKAKAKAKDKKKKKTKTVVTQQWSIMNDQKPIWIRDPKNVTEKEYEEFFNSFFKDSAGKPPLSWIHFKAEGEVDFRSIIYIPSKAPQDLFKKAEDFVRIIKLFVKRVFITDEFIDFIPKYLQFVRAVVDADDLPLNVSRETLQQHKTLVLIKKRLIKKILELISILSKDEEKYPKFIKEYGTSLKLGAIEDERNRRKVAKLLRFPSSFKNGNLTSLDDYISRMKKGQEGIFFHTGASIEEVKQSPFLERLVARNYEVLYMAEPIDEMLVQHMPGYDGKVFQNVAKGDLKFGDETQDDKEELEKLKVKFERLQDWMQASLIDQVEKVEVSNRLTTSPCAVVAQEWGWTGNMQKIMAAQTFKQDDEAMSGFFSRQKKILEINPNHPLILGLLEKANREDFDDTTKEIVMVLYETTLLRSGYTLGDNLGYANRVDKVLRASLGVNTEAKVEINEQPAPEVEEEEKKAEAERLAKQEEEDLFQQQDDDGDDDDADDSSIDYGKVYEDMFKDEL
ncbi:hypothetical protein G9A89_007594 [Geosiphon pyriformis]|nr:hypothetical protein G9A89_007594 [Geosiphon pyriformis]